MENSNKYSFLTVKKSDVLSTDVNTSSESISDVGVIPNANESDADYQEIEVFALEDDSIIQEYCFENADTTLYLDNGNETLSTLYDFSSDDNGKTFSIYTPDGVYIAAEEEQQIQAITYMNAKRFQTMCKKADRAISSSPPISSIFKSDLDCFCTLHSTPIALNGEILDAPSYQKFKKLFTKYFMVSQYIPASSIIDSIQGMLHHYIATGELDQNLLTSEYIKLQNFQELCYNSIYKISHFVENPSSVDLRDLSDSLQKSSRNISNLIDLYLDNVKER